jgi:porin
MLKENYPSLLVLVALALARGLALDVRAGEASNPLPVPANPAVVDWWNGKYATGGWFGVRDSLEDHGLGLRCEWKANVLWNVDGGRQQRFGYDDEWKFLGNLDFARLSAWDALQGLTLSSAVRYRGGAGVNKWVGASRFFAPSNFQGGRLWRFLTAYLTYTTPQLFGIRDFLTVSGGWQNPSDFFIVRPGSKFFINNTFNSGRALAGSGVPWGGSYSAWGGYLRVKPVDWHYIQAGLYLAIPEGAATSNHGLDFQGYGPNPNLNGLYFLAETGFTPKIGPTKLPGRYASGFVYFGVENKSFVSQQTNDGRFAFYWQADQMLHRAPSAAEPSPASAEQTGGKSLRGDESFQGSVPEASPRLSEKGLYLMSLVTFAPSYNNALPFYFHLGLIYKGLIPTRDKDQVGVGVAYGNFSFAKIMGETDRGIGIHQTYEAVAEFDYRIQLNSWSYVQPVVEYIVRPNGTGLLQNATVLGFQLGMTF